LLIEGLGFSFPVTLRQGQTVSASAPARGQHETIFALATAPGRAGVAVIRVSGPRADDALQALTRQKLPAERNAALRTVFDLSNDTAIDVALVLRFVSPRSYTGENVVEVQSHGGPAVVASLLGALGALPGLRLAEPGEFTRRAVENGRLDLTQAEAIADLVAAETESQRRQALRQFEGRLGQVYEDWRGRLIRAAAWVEAAIDFPDEEIPTDAVQRSRQAISDLAAEIRVHLNDGRRGEILRDGLQVAVIGAPNAGKSSLVNALARRDVAIVSPLPGTTRDVIEVRLDLKGYPVVLADTAGLRAPEGSIEEEGIRRARARAEAADLRLIVRDGSEWGGDEAVLEGSPSDLVVWNKADLAPTRSMPGLWISAKTGEGLPELIEQLAARAEVGMDQGEAPVLTRARHRQALELAVESLDKAKVAKAPELTAEYLRQALREIARTTGRVDLDELLDVVFRDFCLGK